MDAIYNSVIDVRAVNGEEKTDLDEATTVDSLKTTKVWPLVSA